MDARTAAGVASRWARIWWPASTPLVGEQPGNRSNNSSVTTVLLTMLPWVAGVQRWQRGALGVGTVGWPLRSVTVRPCAWSLRGYRLQNLQHVCGGLELYSQWDMKNQILRSPDDRDGGSLNPYMVACDDTELGKPAYIAGKNIVYPDRSEIDSVEAHIRKYVWGGLQQTDKEPYPYGVYGIPNWKELRDSPNDDRTGKKHMWRIYDYPHVILMYYNMYQVAKHYPRMVHYLDKDGYLERAYGTAMALSAY